MKIFITGMVPTATSNRGDDAVFMTFCNQVRKVFPDCNITAAVRHPSLDYGKYFNVESIHNLDYSKKIESVGKMFNGFNPGDNRDRLNRIYKEINESNLTVIGGSPFEGISEESIFHGQANYAMLIAQIAIILKKPYIIYAMKVYPLINGKLITIARFVCENALFVTVRENYSFDQLETAKIKTENVKIIGDPAFGIDVHKTSKISNRIYDKHNIKLNKKNVLGVCFRYIYWKWDNNKFDILMRKMANVCEILIESFHFDVIFIPMQVYNKDTFKEDDISVMKILQNKIKYKTYLIEEELFLWDTLSLFSKIDFVLSNRRHINAFASLFNVPSVSLIDEGNINNIVPMMKDLGLEKNFIDIENNSVEEIVSKINSIYNKKSKQKKLIKNNVQNIRESLSKFEEILYNILLKSSNA